MKKLLLLTIFLLPQLAFAGSQTFNMTGADQSFTVPAGVTSISIQMAGAGGGGYGGAGGYTQGTLSVSGGQILTIIAGQGGGYTGAGAYGGGGAGYVSCAYGCYYGGTGGGRSAVRLNGTELMTAGGGGGSYSGGSVLGIIYGGAGGGLTGAGGYTSYSGVNGAGATQTSGNAQFQGKCSNCGTTYGGGGGGWWGGGGTGGGSGYCNGAGVSECTTTQGAGAAAGQNGYVAFTWIDPPPPNQAPASPTISGPISGVTGTSYTYSFRATDPDGDTVRYAIDWDNDGSVDEYAPTLGYVTSGAAASTTHSWSTTGTKTFQVRAQDINVNNSGWTTYSVSLSNPAPVVLLTASPSSITNSQSSTLTWSSAYATSCTGTNFSTASAVSGSVSVSPTVTTAYTLSCTGLGGTASTSKTVTYTCTPANICSGKNVVNSCTGAIITSCSYQCGAGACIAPPAPSFVANGSNTGHLQVRPSIVSSGATAKAYWNVSNVSSCSVTSSNGNSWTGASSLSGGNVSNAIMQQTVFTLACTGLDSSHINETQVVNITPVYQER